jgi:hypothetical protein
LGEPYPKAFFSTLLLPPTDAQLADAGGDHARYDDELRPDLELRTIRELQEADVEPEIWKIEGFQ